MQAITVNGMRFVDEACAEAYKLHSAANHDPECKRLMMGFEPREGRLCEEIAGRVAEITGIPCLVRHRCHYLTGKTHGYSIAATHDGAWEVALDVQFPRSYDPSGWTWG